MSCPNCGSLRARLLNGEIALHVPGLDGLNKPIVCVFPELVVCVNCGATQFIIPEKELQVLVTGSPVDGGAVSEHHGSFDGEEEFASHC